MQIVGRFMPAKEHHRIHRSGWLRAAVLGANDGIVSTASLIAGVAASGASHATILISGLAALVAGALSMAAGEYVSVRSQADTETADLQMEMRSLRRNTAEEHEELVGIYVDRGLNPELAEQVATQLMAHDALDAHARDELGITVGQRAKPVQAAIASAVSFSVGAALPLLMVLPSPSQHLVAIVLCGSLVVLGILGALAARTGGAPMASATLRMMILGGGAIALTAGVGSLFGV
jgi:VIT1/CCC1 family predicted Fe2+/Mn2+ transporter